MKKHLRHRLHDEDDETKMRAQSFARREILKIRLKTWLPASGLALVVFAGVPAAWDFVFPEENFREEVLNAAREREVPSKMPPVIYSEFDFSHGNPIAGEK